LWGVIPNHTFSPGFPNGHELAYHSCLVSKISKMTANPVSMPQKAYLYSGRQITEQNAQEKIS
jgi:hypothetical protein